MNNFFLRLYVATKVRMSERPESGFVTAEHLALAVAGVIIVGAAVALFIGNDGKSGIMKQIGDEVTKHLPE